MLGRLGRGDRATAAPDVKRSRRRGPLTISTFSRSLRQIRHGHSKTGVSTGKPILGLEAIRTNLGGGDRVFMATGGRTEAIPGALIRLPRFAPGQAIGLLGGSFNPPHLGHRLISETALRRLRLDRLWWLATPGNPLKSTRDLAEMRARIAAARGLARDPRIAVTGFEAEIGSRFTFDSLLWLRRRAPSVHFVWIMGADNLMQFHRWRHWREIAELVPILVIDRPGSTLRALSSRAAQALARHRRPEYDAARFATLRPPALLFLHGPRSNQSSSALRQANRFEQSST
jgi:nicotinate-nucleotide adenylyltransferase